MLWFIMSALRRINLSPKLDLDKTDSLLEHAKIVSSQSVLAIVAFILTPLCALLCIRSRATRGSTMSAFRVTIVSIANHMNKLVFSGFVVAASN